MHLLNTTVAPIHIIEIVHAKPQDHELLQHQRALESDSATEVVDMGSDRESVDKVSYPDYDDEDALVKEDDLFEMLVV